MTRRQGLPIYRRVMDRRNDPTSPPGRRRPWGSASPGGPWSRDRAAPVGPDATPPGGGPWSVWNRANPAADGPSLATPFAWMTGSLLLAGTTFLVSTIALVRAIIALAT